jgi:hypothetical protein
MHNTPHSKRTRKLISLKKRGVPLIAKRRVPKTIRGETCWKCPTCKKYLPQSRYFKDKRAWNGITSRCRKCHTSASICTRNAELHRETKRKSAAKIRSEFPEKIRLAERSRPRRKGPKVKARQILNRAVKSGAIVKPDKCEGCGEKKRLTGHHEDYTKPLEVKWLCYLCHAKRHRKQE